MLYGRDAERERLTRLIDDARTLRRSGALLLRGEAGIGKSTLLDHAAGAASGSRVLRATGIEAERDLAYAGLLQLLWPVQERLADLPDPQADALRTVFGSGGFAGSGDSDGSGDVDGSGASGGSAGSGGSRSSGGRRGPGGSEGPGAGRGDRFLIGLALLTLLADLADEEPVVCLVDDVQWIDRASVDALFFAARRLSAEGVVMVFAARDDGVAGHGLPEIELARLGHADAARVLAGRRLAPDHRARILAEADGNPLALLELGAAGWRHDGGHGPLPVADRVLAAFRAQIGRLPERTRLMMLIAAAEGRGHLPTMLGAATDLGVSLDDLEPAEQARLMEVTGTAVSFRHPLIRAAAYQGTSLARRVTVHQALAAAASDPDCGARHRAAAATAPDEDVAADLEAAAVRARDRAAGAAAAALFQQAAQLTPETGGQARRLTEAAGAALLAGGADRAGELAVWAEGLTADPAALTRLARIRAAVEFERGDPRQAARILVGQVADDRQAAAMLRMGASYAWLSGDAETIRAAAERSAAAGRRDPLIQGLAHLVNDDFARGVPLLREVLDGAPDLPGDGRTAVPGAASGSRTGVCGDAGRTGLSGEAGGGGRTGVSGVRAEEPGALVEAIHAGLILGDDDAAIRLATAEVARCRERGQIGELAGALQRLAQAQVAAGLFRDAEANVAEAITVARDTGRSQRVGRLEIVLARVAAVQGDEERCRALTDEALGAGGSAPGAEAAAAACARGLLDLGLGRYDDALDRLEDARHGPGGFTTVVTAGAADQVEAAVRAGRPERAEPALHRFEEWARAAGLPWARAAALRCRALLHDDEAAYAEALRLHDKGGRPFERARTELLYGEWLRRARRRSDAREPLRSALEVFERLRAEPWAERARIELRATGGSAATARPAAADLLERLTPQELQVVRLAAEGNSSRDIAAQLFLSPRTVEYHLYKAYPKLGVSSRRELARLELTR
ncbi:helix-turn-helix transcriptional regulator [Actinoallomurus rhizosphaericola]|uniref:helix-turn-helix transcriptional regulator n=1 Tax=Actinoallomurus rhizosphaericola TaxID=2952536 RepID=UPI002093C907|nr:AAA family ATPase [Actinoallomurus rhizosphaericola]MCO5998266.1 AAA family ATPase [Actinoallomurus rhizosphaericola]